MSREEEEEAQECQTQLRLSRSIYLTPDCCDSMKRCKAIVMSFVQPGEKPHWVLRLSNDTFDIELFKARDDWFRDRSKNPYSFEPPPTHCPYCDAAVPEIVPRADPPFPIMVSDGDYCADGKGSGCGERLMNCTCWPPWFAWEIRR
jgi:hypothetical protein